MNKRSGILVDLSNLKNNIEILKSNIDEGTKFAAVVKADAYGHGALEISKACASNGVDLLCFATAQEAIDILKEDIEIPILVIGPLFDDTLDILVDFKVRQAIFLKEHILTLQQKAEEKNGEAFVHIKVDTGMNRTGVKNIDDFKELLSTIIECDRVVFEGMFTHFAVSDEIGNTFSDGQIEKFSEFVSVARDFGFNPLIHSSNSGGILNLPQFSFDFVRAGISLYGYDPAGKAMNKDIGLKPIMTVYSHVVNINTLSKGESVSYGRTFIAENPMKIATVAIGYGDGFNRLLSNKGYVLVGGKRAKIVGRVCMDMIMVDITDTRDVEIGDEVIVIGTQGDNTITADEHADMCGTISYEVLLSFTSRLKREYING